MLTNAQKLKQHLSISPPSAVSVGLSNSLDAGLQLEEHLDKEMISRISPPAKEAAQQLLAGIAVRIVTQRRTDEK